MFDNLRQTNEQKASNTLELNRHEEMKLAFIQTQETILKAFSSLVEYLDNKVTKAEVVNQLREVGTPDALKVVASIEGLHTTLKTHENTDISPLVEVMNKVLSEAQKIPKELPKEIELDEQIDYSKHFKDMATAIKAVEEAVKAQETNVEAPVVNIDAPVVKVDAPDLKPLEKASDKLLKAIQGIVIPEVKPTNIEPLVKEQKKTNKILMELPIGGGGGGGGGNGNPYQDATGNPVYIQVNPDGSLPTNPILKKIIDTTTTANVTYIGEAGVGTATSTEAWRIQRIDESGTYTEVFWSGIQFNVAWDDRATVTYG